MKVKELIELLRSKSRGRDLDVAVEVNCEPRSLVNVEHYAGDNEVPEMIVIKWS